MIFSEELRRRRQAMGLGQTAFAMKIRRAAAKHGWSEPALDGNTVSRWEAGRQFPDAFHLALLGDVLGVTNAEMATWHRITRASGRMTPVRRRDFLIGTAVASSVLLDGWRLAAEVERLAVHGPLCPAERSVLTETIGRSIESGWHLFHTADTEHMLSVGRAELYMLRRHSGDLDPDALPALYSAACRLLGATYHRRGRYHQALEAHDSAYLAASEAGDVWNMAQCRSWQAYGQQALGRYADSVQLAGAALRLISDKSDTDSLRLRGRLLTSVAMNAATLHDTNRVGPALEASEGLLNQLDTPSEEFDRAVWLDCTAVCALRLGQPDRAATRFREALEATPNEWIPRRVFSTIGLATALTDSGDVETALELSDSLVPQLQTVQSRELTEHFVSYLRTGLLAKYPSHPHGLALLAQAALTSKQL